MVDEARAGGKGLGKPQLGRALLALAPLLILWVVEATYHLHTAIFLALCFTMGELIFTFLRHKRVDRSSLVIGGLVLVSGGISLALDTGLLFKLKPAVVEAVFALVLIGSVFLGKSIFLDMAEKQLGRRIPLTRRDAFRGMTIRLGAALLLHAALVAVAAVWLPTEVWVFVKGVGTLIVLGLYLVGEMLYIRRVLRPRWAAQEAAARRRSQPDGHVDEVLGEADQEAP